MEVHVRAILDSFNIINAVDFDFEDCDNILRVEVSNNITSEIEALLQSKGFDCEELE